MGEFVNKIIPLYITIVNNVKDENKSDDLFDLIENCLNTINMLLIRCFKSAKVYLDNILTFTQVMLVYDPNYLGNSEIKSDEESDDDAWSIDSEPVILVDDNSWKVRKAASLLLDTIISTHTGSFRIIYSDVIDLLITRIDERDLNVKNYIIKSIASLLKTVKPSSDFELPGFCRTITDQVSKENVPMGMSRTLTEDSISDKIKAIIENICKQFEGKGKLTKENKNEIILMIRIMSSVLPNETAAQ